VSHEAKLNELRERLGVILDLNRASALLGWDQQTMMPPKGTEGRSYQLSTIDRFSHELFVSDEIGELLDELEQAGLDPDSIDGALIRVTRRDYDKARKVPGELRSEITKAEVIGIPAWAEARQNSDYEAFLPYLEKNVELKRRYVDCFKDTGKSDYDILLDDYQEGARSEEITEIFERIKEVVIPLISEVASAQPWRTPSPTATIRSRSRSSSAARSSSGSATPRRRGASIRPCIRSRRRSRSTTSA
jgi:carboxypeptidase Taq